MLLFLLLVLAGIGLWFWMTKIELHLYQLNRHQIRIYKKLPKPLKVLHLSDTHFAEPNPALSRYFDRLSQQDVDLVVITGDIIDCKDGIPVCVEQLKKLKPKYGTFAVFGNHDYYSYDLPDVFLHNFPGQSKPSVINPSGELQHALESIDVHVLKNQTHRLNFEGADILIHGVDDPTTGRAKIRSTLSRAEPTKVNLLLTHTVDAFRKIKENQVDVSFSGHSHGGQVRFPIIGAIITHTTLGRKYVSGVTELKGAKCSISRGIGYSRFLRMRFLCRPETILLEINGA